MKGKHLFSITKFGETVNEDAVLVKEDMIAISDGAGGGGVFADEWSRYLLDCLPNKPFEGFDTFESWVNSISDSFYLSHEEIAKRKGGLFLEKFYDEGSFATLVAVWRVSSDEYVWVAYGDSVAFAYDPQNNTLEHSFTHLVDFNLPPHLISLISPLNRDGYKTGRFIIAPGTYVFVASDALAHYILASFYSNNEVQEEMRPALESKCRNAIYVKSMLSYANDNYYECVIRKIVSNVHNKVNIERMLKKLYKNNLIGLDDYSMAFMPKTDSNDESDDELLLEQNDYLFPHPDCRPLPRKIEEYNGIIENIDDYYELLDTLSHYHQKYILLYRGHGDFDWPLIPTIIRKKGSYETERQIFPELKKVLKGQYGNFRTKSENEELFYLSIGRHLGLTCRLLDWTASIDTAIDFFLLEDKWIKIDGALWIMAIPKDYPHIENGSFNPFVIADNDIHAIKEDFFSPDDSEFPSAISRRFHQHGWFTVTSEQYMHYPLFNISIKAGIKFIDIRIPSYVKKRLVELRSQKKYQLNRNTYQDYVSWYMAEVPNNIQMEIERMNHYIEGKDM